MPTDITKILRDWSAGDRSSLDDLVPLVYGELRRLAHRALNKNNGDGSFQTTALVNEAYLKLIDVKQIDWQNRVHFFAVSASLMRNILVDFARQRLSQKRGGEKTHVALDESLKELAQLSERQSRVVELKFFGGLTEEEISEVLNISPATIKRDWQAARAWLYRQLTHT